MTMNMMNVFLSKERKVIYPMKKNVIAGVLLITTSLVSSAVYAEKTVIKVGSLVAGQVTKVYVSEGQEVKAGDKLLDIDSSRYQAKLSLLKAQQSMAKLNMNDAKIELNQALDLFDRTVTSKRTLDASQLRYDIAQAAYQKAKAEIALHQAWSKYVYVKSPVNAKVVKIVAPVGTTVFKENTPMIELESQ